MFELKISEFLKNSQRNSQTISKKFPNNFQRNFQRISNKIPKDIQRDWQKVHGHSYKNQVNQPEFQFYSTFMITIVSCQKYHLGKNIQYSV